MGEEATPTHCRCPSLFPSGPRLDFCLNFKLHQRPTTNLLLPTGGLQDTFSSGPWSRLTGGPWSHAATSSCKYVTLFKRLQHHQLIFRPSSGLKCVKRLCLLVLASTAFPLIPSEKQQNGDVNITQQQNNYSTLEQQKIKS